MQALWADANREAQLNLLKVLDGGGPNVSTGQGVVTLHLQTAAGVDGGSSSGSAGGSAAAIPASAANLVVLRSGQLETAQNAVNLLRKLPYILIGGSLLLFAIALGVARDWRRKAVRGYGIGLALAGAAALLARDLARAVADRRARQDGGRAPGAAAGLDDLDDAAGGGGDRGDRVRHRGRDRRLARRARPGPRSRSAAPSRPTPATRRSPTPCWRC